MLLPETFRSLPRPSSPYSSIGIHHKPISSLDHIIFSSQYHFSLIPKKHIKNSFYFYTYLKPSLTLTYLVRTQKDFFPYNFLSLPSSFKERSATINKIFIPTFLEIRGFEPLTYGLQSRRSSQLSYIPLLQTNNKKREEERRGI